MGKLVQVRDVPERVHRTLKARAAVAGVSLSEYLRVELERLATLPSAEELRERLRRHAPVHPTLDPTAVVRELRESGD